MDKVEIEFHNIQSHAHSKFYFIPGMNFIISSDNNVGKSTIMVTLTTIAHMPNSNNEDFRDLLRNGESSGYAAFKYIVVDAKGHRMAENVVLWLTRDGKQVRGFIEYIANGTTQRQIKPPKSFYDALGIKVTRDGEVLNVINANSVQLFVDDDISSDNIIADILIDMDVERVKENLATLNRQATNDSRDYFKQNEEMQKVLTSLSYNYMVDEFKVECDILQQLANAADAASVTINWETFDRPGAIQESAIETLEELEVMRAALEVARDLQVVIDNLSDKGAHKHGSETASELAEEFAYEVALIKEANTAISLLREVDASLQSIETARRSAPNVLSQGAEQAARTIAMLKDAMETIKIVGQATTFVSNIMRDRAIKNATERDANSLRSNLEKSCPKVVCPVKGEVYYGEKCIPTNN